MSKPKFPKDFGKVSSKKADVFGNKFESLAHHAEDRPDLPSEWGSMERAERDALRNDVAHLEMDRDIARSERDVFAEKLKTVEAERDELKHASCPTCPKCGWYTCDHGEGSVSTVADLAFHDVEIRSNALEEAATHIENGSAYSGHAEVGKIHAEWIRALIDAPKEGK